jgi:hypothetical protein
MSKNVCVRCKRKYKSLPQKIVEIALFFEYSDLENPLPPLIIDLGNQNVRLCSSCIRAGAIPELVESIKHMVKLPERKMTHYKIAWAH